MSFVFELERYNSAVLVSPESATTWAERADFYRDDQMNPEALSDYEKAVEIDSSLIAAWLDMAICYLREDRYDEAIHSLSRCVSLNPDCADAWSYRAQMRYAHGDIELSVKDANKAMAIRRKSENKTDDFVFDSEIIRNAHAKRMPK